MIWCINVITMHASIMAERERKKAWAPKRKVTRVRVQLERWSDARTDELMSVARQE